MTTRVAEQNRPHAHRPWVVTRTEVGSRFFVTVNSFIIPAENLGKQSFNAKIRQKKAMGDDSKRTTSEAHCAQYTEFSRWFGKVQASGFIVTKFLVYR